MLRWRSSNAILEPSKVIPLDPRRFRWPVEPWMTYEQLAVVLIVSRKRLYNLVALHKLDRRIQWIGGGRAGKRLRITLLPPATCRELARLTGKPYLSTTAAEPT